MPLRFIDAVTGREAVGPSLPFVHTTSSPAFEYNIEPSETLEKQLCDIYNDKLLYFFYGKPSYRPKGEKDRHHADMMQFAPICLVLDILNDVAPKRIMPFDSGAYHNGIVTQEGHAHHKLRKELFELQDRDAPGTIVGLFFGTNQAYYDELPKSPPEIDPRQNTCVETYVSLISRTGSNNGDSRLNSIEIQFDSDIKLNANCSVLAVAMAEPFYQQRPEIQNSMTKWGAEPLLYPLNGRFSVGECCYVIDGMVRKFLTDRGYL